MIMIKIYKDIILFRKYFFVMIIKHKLSKKISRKTLRRIYHFIKFTTFIWRNIKYLLNYNNKETYVIGYNVTIIKKYLKQTKTFIFITTNQMHLSRS